MKLLSLFTLLFCLFNASANTSSVEGQIVKDIKKAQSVLNKTQENITQQSQKIHLNTHKLEQKVLSLRKETAAARRLVDEQTLSLTALEKRLTSWQQQDTYQRNLLSRFAQQQNITPNEQNILSDNSLRELSSVFSSMRSALQPQFKTAPVVTYSGVIKPQSILSVGPIAWFVDNANEEAGFLITEDKVIKQGLQLPEEQYAQLNLLAQNKASYITFDPTLTRALKIAQSHESVLQHVEKGGVWVLPILAFGLFALLISLFKGFQLSKLPNIMPALAERLSHIDVSDPQNLTNLNNNVKGMQKELLNIAVSSKAGQHRDDQLFSALLMQKHKLEYWLGAVAITAAVSPLLGLLGTVSGMIETFKLMTLFGAGDASAVSGGISEALVTTELGLVVAIPALLMHALLSRKVKTYYGSLESCAVQLSQCNTLTQTQPNVEAA